MSYTSGIIIYSNPVSNTFHFSKKCDYEIYTMLIQEVFFVLFGEGFAELQEAWKDMVLNKRKY